VCREKEKEEERGRVREREKEGERERERKRKRKRKNQEEKRGEGGEEVSVSFFLRKKTLMKSESAVKNADLPWQTRLLASSMSSGVIAALVQPLEVVKTMVQRPKIQHTIRTPLSAMREVVKLQGVRALWKGLSPSLWRCVPGVTLYINLLSEMQKLPAVKSLKKTNPILCDFMTAGGARAVCTVVLLPLTVVKTRSEAMAATSKSVSTISSLRVIARGEGVRSLFAGLSASLVRDVPSAGLFFVIYETGRAFLFQVITEQEGKQRKRELEQQRERENHPESEESYEQQHQQQQHKLSQQLRERLTQSAPFTVSLMSGVVAGFTSTLITQPADVIRARQQLSGRTDTFVVTKEVFRENGIRGFLAGCTPRLLRRSVTTAFTWASFEGIVSIVDYMMTTIRKNK